jgi:hypothetical protein
MANIQIINPINYNGWDDLLLATQDYSFFHTSYWARVLAESYGYEVCYFADIDKDRLVGLIPLMGINSMLTGRRGVSLPFSDYCEPIAAEEERYRELFHDINNFGRKSAWRYVELRGGSRFFQDKSPSSQYCGHILELAENGEKLLSSFRSSTRRNIKKAIRQGVEVHLSKSPDSLKEFYRLHCATRKYHGVPPQPRYFFNSIYDHIISQGHGMVILASYNKKIISGAVFFHFGDKAIYKYGASDRDYLHMRANNLVMWKAIEYYAGDGYKTFCFGKTDYDNKGLMQFKDGWNTEKVKITYYKYNIISQNFEVNRSKLYRHSTYMFKRMPNVLLKSIGILLYKHMA